MMLNEDVKKYYELSNQYLETDLDNCIRYSRLALNLLSDSKNNILKSHLHKNLGVAYKQKQEMDTAIKMLIQALYFSDSLDDKFLRIDILETISQISIEQANYRYAYKVLSEMLELEKSISDMSKVADTHFNLGKTTQQMGLYEQAISHYIQALDTIDKHNLSNEKIRILINIGIIKTETPNYEAASQYFDDALKLVSEDDYDNLAQIFSNYANLDIVKKSYVTATKKLEKAMSIYEELADKNGIISTLKMYGKLYLAQQKFTKAIAVFQEIKKMIDEEEDTFLYAEIQHNLGAIYLENNDMDKAFDELNSSLFIAKYYDLKTLMRNNYLQLSIFHEKTHNPGLALSNYKSYVEVKDEILNSKNLRMLTEIRLKYENDKKERKIRKYRDQFIDAEHKNNILDSIIDSIPHPVSLKDTNGYYLKSNHLFSDNFDMLPYEIIGKHVTDLHKKEMSETIIREDLDVLENNHKLTIEINDTDFFKKGSSFIISKSPFLVDGKVAGVVSIIVDVTQQKKIQNKLLESQKSLQRKNNEKDMFFSILAHDLKNPLSGMIVTLEYLTNNFEKLKQEKVQKFIRNLNHSVNNINNLLEDLLKWSGAQTGRLKADNMKLSLCNICNDNIMLFKESADNKNIKIVNNLDKDMIVDGDANMVSTIFRNLISNAIKFSYPDNIIAIDPINEEKQIGFSIKDKGQGMTDEQIENIFSLKNAKTYTRTGTKNESGTGLGLPICLEFIKLMNGEITINSNSNGTTFFVKFPIDPGDL